MDPKVAGGGDSGQTPRNGSQSHPTTDVGSYNPEQGDLAPCTASNRKDTVGTVASNVVHAKVVEAQSDQIQQHSLVCAEASTDRHGRVHNTSSYAQLDVSLLLQSQYGVGGGVGPMTASC
jgi:hypothetical protein